MGFTRYFHLSDKYTKYVYYGKIYIKFSETGRKVNFWQVFWPVL